LNCARLNEFPEWFTVNATTGYELRVGTEKMRHVAGTELTRGVPVTLKAGQTITLNLALAK
jgi:hypothetical protein